MKLIMATTRRRMQTQQLHHLSLAFGSLVVILASSSLLLLLLLIPTFCSARIQPYNHHHDDGTNDHGTIRMLNEPDSSLEAAAAAAATTTTNLKRRRKLSYPAATTTTTATTTNPPRHNYYYKKKTTRLLNPDLCLFESHELCREMDDSMIRHADQTRTLIETTGNLQILVLLLEFHDHHHQHNNSRTLIDPNHISTLFNADEEDSSSSSSSSPTNNNIIIPTGSIKTYLQKNSYGKLNIEATIIPWYTIPYNESNCTKFDSSNNNTTTTTQSSSNSGLDRRFQQCIWPMLDALDRLHDDSSHDFDWSKFDQNGDGVLDSVVVMTSSYGAEYGGIDPNGKSPSERVWSHSIGPTTALQSSSSSSQSSTSSAIWMSQNFDISLGGYCVTSAYRGYERSNIARLGIVVHELIHTFGIPDLFDVHRQDQIMGGIGSYSVMSNAWGPTGDGTFPGSLDPWSKLQLGWIQQPKTLTSNGNYEMLPSATSPDVYIIDRPYYPNGEYLLIENRQPIMEYELGNGDNGGGGGGGGALIWHIDENVDLETQMAGGPYQVGWPQNGNHYRVALVQADGLFELERGINKGDKNDFFNGGSFLSPGYNNTIFPNTDSYQSGHTVETGIVLSNFVTFGSTVFFTVKFPEKKHHGGCNGVKHNNENSSSPPPPHPEDIIQHEQIIQQQQPTLEENGCLIRVNTQLCSHHRQLIQLQDGCECYNVCGDGTGQQTCCKKGEICSINCLDGGIIAGCTHENIGLLLGPDDDPPLLMTMDSNNNNEDDISDGGNYPGEQILVEIQEGDNDDDDDEGCEEDGEEDGEEEDEEENNSGSRSGTNIMFTAVVVIFISNLLDDVVFL